jgi:hypothetical protein
LPKNQRDCGKTTPLAKKYEKQRFRVDAFWQKPYRPARHSTAHISSPKPDQQNIRRLEGDAPHALVRACKIFSRGFRANRPRKRQESYAPLGPVASGLLFQNAYFHRLKPQSPKIWCYTGATPRA